MNVLIVDDSSAIRTILRQAVEQHLRAPVWEASHCREAIAVAEDAAPLGLVITDLIMPGRDGVKLIEHLRQHPDCSGTPILVVSVEAVDPEARARAMAAGADGFLNKPFHIHELYGAIDAIFAGRGEQ